ncbi:MAG: fimbrial protein [Burkholderiaceae bacterium]|nr:fimbrial protein [Burkholderiaceae bacterium]
MNAVLPSLLAVLGLFAGAVTAGHAAAPIEAGGDVVMPDASAYWPTRSTVQAGGLNRLAPVEAMPVQPIAPVAMKVESPLATECAAALDDEGNISTVQWDMSDPWMRLLAETCEQWAIDRAQAVPTPDPVYAFGLQWSDRFTPSRLGLTPYRPVRKQATLAALPSTGGTRYNARNIVVQQSDGLSLSLGSSLTRAPAWSDAARLSGVQLSNWGQSQGGVLTPGSWGYSTSFGVLDYTDTAATSGNLHAGGAAGSTSLRYGVLPGWTLETYAESGPALSTMGVGSATQVGPLGTLRVGATESEYESRTATRTRLGYSVAIAEAVKVGYTNEQIGAGYNDLSDFRSGAAATDQVRNTFSAGVPLGRLGTLTGTYAGLRGQTGMVERRVGLAHDMALSRSVGLGLAADRDTISGDYAMRMNLRMPVDTFLGHLRLPSF